MEVSLIASTSLTIEGFTSDNTYSLDPIIEHLGMLVEGDSSADALAEFAGRNCYQSFSKPNPKTAANADYLANILAQSHESVLEHASATFYVEGASRALLAELSRHRHLSFSVVSQRYVDANQLDTVYPPIMDELEGMDWPIAHDLIRDHHEDSLATYNKLVDLFKGAGYKRKQAREAARAVLPNSVASPMVVTGNLRAWRDVLKKRYHVAADKELQEFASYVLEDLRKVAPNSFQDFPTEPIGTE